MSFTDQAFQRVSREAEEVSGKVASSGGEEVVQSGEQLFSVGDFEMKSDPPPWVLSSLPGGVGGHSYTLTPIFDDVSVMDQCRGASCRCQSAEQSDASRSETVTEVSEGCGLDLSQIVVAVTISARDLALRESQAYGAVGEACGGLQSSGEVVSLCVASTELFKISTDLEAFDGQSRRGYPVEVYQVYDVLGVKKSAPQDVVMLIGLGLVQSGVDIVVNGVVYTVPPVIPRGGGVGVLVRGESAGVLVPGYLSKRKLHLETVTDGMVPEMLSSGYQEVSVMQLTSTPHGEAYVLVPVRTLMSRDVQYALCTGLARPWFARDPGWGFYASSAYRVGNENFVEDLFPVNLGEVQPVLSHAFPAVGIGSSADLVRVTVQHSKLIVFLWLVWDVSQRKLLCFRCCEFGACRTSKDRE